MAETVCRASKEAVIDYEECGEVGCPLCGRPADTHSSEDALPAFQDDGFKEWPDV